MQQMIIDTKFNFCSDARDGDPDRTSPTLRKYHKILWNKPLPNGKTFDLCTNKNDAKTQGIAANFFYNP